MTDSGYTTITVKEETKEKLNEQRDRQPWDVYLTQLLESESGDIQFEDLTVELEASERQKLAEEVAKKVTENIP